MLCHSPLPSKIHHPPTAINIQHYHPKSSTHHAKSPSTITIVHPSSTIAEITIMNDIFPPEWYIFWDYIHLLLFFLRDGAIQSLVIFRVHNSVEFPGGWEDEEEDELWEGSGESVSVGAAVGAVGQRLLEQPGSHYSQPACNHFAGDEQSWTLSSPARWYIAVVSMTRGWLGKSQRKKTTGCAKKVANRV